MFSADATMGHHYRVAHTEGNDGDPWIEPRENNKAEPFADPDAVDPTGRTDSHLRLVDDDFSEQHHYEPEAVERYHQPVQHRKQDADDQNDADEYYYEGDPTPGEGFLADRIEEFDRLAVEAMGRLALPMCRIGLGVIFFWFGFLKFIDGMSPAQALVEATIFELGGLMGFTSLPTAPIVFVLAVWEVAIGIGFLANRHPRLVLIMLFLQLPGTMLPLVLLPSEVWHTFPFGLTLEGQYIIKNLVLIGAAFALGSQIRLNEHAEQQHDEWAETPTGYDDEPFYDEAEPECYPSASRLSFTDDDFYPPI